MRRTRYLESASPWNNAFVYNHVVYAAQPITDGVRNLSDSMRIGALNQKRNGLRILNLLLERQISKWPS